MELYGGIDLHSNNNVVVLTDEQDQMLLRRRLPNRLDRVLEELVPYREDIKGLVVESTYNCYLSHYPTIDFPRYFTVIKDKFLTLTAPVEQSWKVE
uniref:Transposase n=1 Tax=Candidatus Kentrum sp. TUN TaxID=2126343 RepID=A0A451AG75_9GAMM|nr:MAG: hypothetical protein BECKTUN1418D_GA0071000_13101 [Candidatus Kentron sp. TUN]